MDTGRVGFLAGEDRDRRCGRPKTDLAEGHVGQTGDVWGDDDAVGDSRQVAVDRGLGLPDIRAVTADGATRERLD